MRSSAHASHMKPAAASPARRAAVVAKPAIAGNSGARATVPRIGAAAGSDHARPVRGARTGEHASATPTTSAVPSYRFQPSQATKPAAARSQPARGRSATPIATAAAAAVLEKRGFGPRVSSPASASPPAAAPATPRVTTSAERPLGSARRRAAVVRWIPNRSSVSGSRSPPLSRSSDAASASPLRRARRGGRRSGTGSSAASTHSQGSWGRSGRSEASAGSRRPSRLAVAAGLGPRTGFVPVQASYRVSASAYTSAAAVTRAPSACSGAM